MLNDSSEAEVLLKKVKEELNELYHSDIAIYEKYREMFKEEPPKRARDFLNSIEVPIVKLREIYELI
jgi:hypothetical protein